MQYYIIDDLRLPPKRTFHKGWTMERFPSLQEALARYRALPSRQAKSLGMTDGIHVLELARHVLIYPAETAWEDVQAARKPRSAGCISLAPAGNSRPFYASGRGLDIPWCFAVRQMDSRNRALISYWRHCPGNTTY